MGVEGGEGGRGALIDKAFFFNCDLQTGAYKKGEGMGA